MNNSAICFERIDDAILTTSAIGDGLNPLSNLKDGRYATQWKSGATDANQWIKFQFPVARTIDYLFLANHNLAATGISWLNLEFSNDGTTWASPIAISGTADPFFVALSAVTSLYLRVTFVKASALSVAPQIGMIFVGKQVQLPLYLNNPKRGLKSNIIRDESLSGLPFRAVTSAERQTWAIDYGAMKQIEISEAFRWLRGIVVGLHPFWFKDMDDNWHFVGYDVDSAASAGKGNVMFDLKSVRLSEERVGIPMNLPGGFAV